MRLKGFFVGVLLVCGASFMASGQSKKTSWIDSTFNSMDQEEKIGQLFMVTVSPDNFSEIESEIKNHEIGGVVFRTGGPVWQAKLIRSFQRQAAIPLLIGLDSEWQTGVSFDSAANFPSPLILGAVEDDSLIHAMARATGRSMSELGIHINFDLPAEIITDSYSTKKARSLGSNKDRVAHKALVFMKGLREEGVLSCPRHFTLKGLTIVGVQNHLPVFHAGIDSVRAFPFQQLIANDVSGILPSAVELPLFYEKKTDIKKNKLSTGAISALFTGGWMKKNMGFQGLAFVDIEKAREATNYRSGEAEVLALQAGNDILISPEDIGPAIRKIKRLLRSQKQYVSYLDSTVKRILALKYDAGLWDKKTSSTNNLVKRISAPETRLLKQKLYEAAITVTQDQQSLLPIRSLENKKIAFVTNHADEYSNQFHHYLSKYAKVIQFAVDENTNEQNVIRELSSFDIIIAGIFPQNAPEKIRSTLKSLSDSTHSIIICDFGHETFLTTEDEFSTVIAAYTKDSDILKAVPQVIFGGLEAIGSLPFTISKSITEGAGIKTPSLNRFSYSLPEDAGMDSRRLERIEAIALEAIQTKATPGCHVLIARNGKVVYEKSFGHLTYEKLIPVTDETIYDLASVTKVSATLQAVMFMYEKGLIDINKKASFYLPELKDSNKKDFTLKDILTHQAGLWPFIPFWALTMKDSLYMPEFYSQEKNDQYPFIVSNNLYASAAMKDSLWTWIVKAKIREKPDRTPFDYRYSDMGFYILQHLAEKLLNQPIDDFLDQNLYEPLGAYSTGYLPLQRFSPDRIAPTENDRLFRKSLLTGVVHDQGAAMHGGVAGHAGLFSNANDLAKLGQMLLQEGNYGGYQFYKPETVRLFTQRTFDTSRRGLGWDKPTPSDWNGPTSLYASKKTFGHTGFTGTCIWVDPEFNLVYIFLSNRVHPDMTNNKLNNANIRSRIQDVIYESIFNYCRY